MKITPTAIPDVRIVEPVVFGDERGFFLESFNRRALAQAGLDRDFVQDNHSRSRRGVLRGLHYQIPRAQGKLVRILSGEIYDVAVDLRRSSPSFGRWVGVSLSAENKRMLWIPEGFAHGFLVLSEFAEVFYKVTEYYAPQCERSLLWNDPDLAIAWPACGDPILSEKDRQGARLNQAEVYD
jgi:dTDP-4-dehydrorhamnose 3,5-epimerase